MLNKKYSEARKTLPIMRYRAGYMNFSKPLPAD
jgi:hypothetical protein